MIVLGIWDGHDAGAALLVDGRLVAAANEERFTRRKLDVVFPGESIRVCLDIARIRADEVDVVAGSTLDVAKALGRVLPSTKERYYRVRRRQAAAGALAGATRVAKYRMTEWRPTWWSRRLNAWALRRPVAAAGLRRARLQLFDHHLCHAAAAAHGSGFPSCAVVTMDGVGDGASASVGRFHDGALDIVSRTPARSSPGVFFEHVTSLLNMRELEDEGKVMALADYAAPIADDRNPLLNVLWCEGLQFRTSRPGHALRRVLRRHLWFFPNEQFASMAQRALTRASIDLIGHAVAATGESRVALAGGVASNVKAVRAIRELPEVSDVFVFPHMGDGGLACGAATLAAAGAGDTPRLELGDLGLGPEYGEDELLAAIQATTFARERPADIAESTADLIAAGSVVLWFQGRMEYGPRALGHRSILARPDRVEIRDRLNLLLKRRVWYQPFCPSVLESDARCALAEWKGHPNRHMTAAYAVRPEYRQRLAGVVHIDGTCRPQIVADGDGSPYGAVLRAVRQRLGIGAVLNTSFNIHGQPLVCTPGEALDVFARSGADAIAIGPFLVRARPEGSSAERP